MICVLSTNNSMEFGVELHNTSMLGIGGFIKRIIASNPLVTLVVLSQLRPKPKNALLVIPVIPDCKFTSKIIRKARN